MSIFSTLFGYGHDIATYVVPFLVILTLIVFVHEFGHFLVARWCGVAVKTFSIGFGPEIFGRYDRHGTRWCVAWIPLGGYVKFIDDENAASAGQIDIEQLPEEERARTFQGKRLWQRAAIVAAGPFANFVLAVAIFTIVFSVFGQQVTAAKVDSVKPGSPAATAGFKPGDLILSVDGDKVADFGDLQQIVSGSAGKTLTFVVERADSHVTLTATPKVESITDPFGNKIDMPILGIERKPGPGGWTLKREDPLTATGMAVKQCYFVVSRSLSYLYEVATGRAKADQLGGPIRIAQISGEAASVGFLALINFAAVISVSIGLINLFPIPMLDGGHLLFFAIEGIRGRPLSEQTQEVGFRIGLALVLMLMIFATWNDLIHIKIL